MKIKMKRGENYQPVSCDYYDELTLVAQRRTPCQIAYRGQNGVEKKAGVTIRDIFTREKEEFLLLSTGEEIRLDQVIHVYSKQASRRAGE